MPRTPARYGSGDNAAGGIHTSPGTRDFAIAGLWGRLTAEPRSGWYSWRAAVPKADGTWTLLPAEQPYAYGTAHASDPAQDKLPARGANAEAGVPANTTTGAVVWLEFDPVTPGYRFGGGGAGSGGGMIAYSLADNPGTGNWTPGTMMTFTAAGELTALEFVEMKPLKGTLVVNEPYVCVDSGKRSPATNRRRVWAERVGGTLPPDQSVTLTFYRSGCQGGYLTETPYTVTLAGPGLRQGS